MRNVITCFVFALGLAAGAAACGSSSSSGGSGGSAGCGTGGASSCSAYTNCAESRCAQQETNCYGANRASGDYTGGACATYADCLGKCGCNNDACVQACGQPDTTCLACMTTLAGCGQQSCSAELQSCQGGTGGSSGTGGSGGTGGTGTGGSGGTTGGTCADLATCCTTLPAGQANCNNVAQAGNESNCNTALQGMQAAGYCN
jgi:hypothetical protein